MVGNIKSCLARGESGFTLIALLVGHGAYYVGGDSTQITQSTPPAAVATVTKVNSAGSATGAQSKCNALS